MQRLPLRGEATPLRTITNIRDLKALSEMEADRHYPVHIRAVVTFHASGERLTFVQDQTGASYLDGVALPIHAGQRLEVKGTTDSGRFAPMILPKEIHVLGPGKMPKPLLLRSPEMNTGRLDSLFVETEGVVHSFRRETSVPGTRAIGFYLTVATLGERLIIWVPYPGNVDPEKLIGAKIRAFGPIVASGNRRRQLTDTFQVVQSAQDIRVMEGEKVDVRLAAPMPIANLMKFDPNRAAPLRARVRGIVTLVRSGRYVTLQEGKSGVSVETDQSMNFRPGTIADAVGFPSISRYSPALHESHVRVVVAGPPLAPALVDAQAADEGEHDMQLIRIRAEVLSAFHGQDEQALRLRSGKTTFIAVLDERQPPNKIDQVEVGSMVEISGVCRNHVVDGEPAGFQLLLRSDEDVRVVSLPPWKLSSRTLQVLGWGALVLLLVVVSNIILRRRVKRQTMQIEKSADFERERNAILELVGRHENLGCVLERIQKLVEREIPASICQIQLAEPLMSPSEQGSSAHRSHVAPIVASDGSILGTLSLCTTESPEQGDTALDLPSVAAKSAARLAGIAIEHRELYDRLTRQSQQDTLTGLANRFLLEERLAEAVSEASLRGQRVACIYIDLDGFKQINDCWGHRAGDIVLQCAATRMKNGLRWSDTVARIGGDEFCIILTGLDDREPAEAIALKLVEKLQLPILVEGAHLSLSASIGLSFFPEHGKNLEDLQRNADAAMYRAKRAGKGRLTVFEPDEGLCLHQKLG